MKHALILAVLTLAVAGPASAEKFYKWKDQNGVWQYTTTPAPAGAESSTVSVQAGGSSSDSPAIEPNQADSTAAAAQAGQQSTSDMTDDIRKKRAEMCEKAKERVEVLRSNAVVELDRDGDGKGEQLSVEQHSAELSKAQQGVTVYCAPG